MYLSSVLGNILEMHIPGKDDGQNSERVRTKDLGVTVLYNSVLNGK